MKSSYLLTCTICPNGCGLSLTEKDGDLQLEGNRCGRGLLFAKFQLEQQDSRQIILKEKNEEPKEQQIREVLRFWGKERGELNHSEFIQGSPERSSFRIIIKCEGSEYLLEQFPESKGKDKERIYRRLKFLEAKGLPVTPPIKAKKGLLAPGETNDLWQLTPYIKGTTLKRNSFWMEHLKGAALGQFLRAFREADPPVEPGESPFDFPSFLNDLWEKIERSEPELWLSLTPVVAFLEKNYLPKISQQAVKVSHGDPHPLNILWKGDSILSVIDWEFSGPNSLLYDPALALGCVGSEDPRSFAGPFNTALVKELWKSPKFSSENRKFLFPQVMAQRFAWLNEWLRHEDREMLQQELIYMDHLLENHNSP